MTQTAAEQALDNLRAEIKELEYELRISQNSIVSHAWIVVYPSDIVCAYEFDVVAHPTLPNRKQATNPRVSRPHKCNRFTKEDARTVADDCRDKNGNPLTIAHWSKASAALLVQKKKLVAFLEDSK